jgi:single-strand DNA-binding protein
MLTVKETIVKSVNIAIVVGRLGADPESGRTHAGTNVTNFHLATTSSWTDKYNERHESTDWHRVVAWGKLAKICDNLKKGMWVFVKGSSHTKPYDPGDGIKRYFTSITAHEVACIGRHHPVTDNKPLTDNECDLPPFDYNEADHEQR